MPTTDLFKSIEATEGYVADPDDFNNAQRSLTARVFDQVIAKFAANLTDVDLDFHDKNGANIPTGPYAYALHGGGARPIQGSTNAKIKITAGTLLQKVAADDGADAQLIAYTFPGTDEVTIAAGDITHPRVDLVQMKLEYVDADLTARNFEDATTRAKSTSNVDIPRRVQCTLSVKQGTPAAAPTYPAPDAGYVVIAGVVVETLYAAADVFQIVDTGGGPVAVLHDQRMPLGLRDHHVFAPKDWYYDDAVWGIGVGGGSSHTAVYIKATAVPGDAVVVCPIGGGTGRVIGVALTAKDAGVTEEYLAWYEHSNGGLSFTKCNGAVGWFSADASLTRRINGPVQIQANHKPAVGSTVHANANGMGPPMWTSGMRCPMPLGTFAAPEAFHAVCLLVRNAPNNAIIGPVTFYVAGGI